MRGVPESLHIAFCLCNSVCVQIIYGRQFISVCQGLDKCIHPPFMELFQLDAEIFITLAQQTVKGLHTHIYYYI